MILGFTKKSGVLSEIKQKAQKNTTGKNLQPFYKEADNNQRKMLT